MFNRPGFYHPYKPPTPRRFPAGFRVADYINPRRCFNLFQGADFDNTRSPAPSPLSSPLKPPHHPDDDAPPTLRLADLFANGFESPNRPPTPVTRDHRDATPRPKETNVPAQDLFSRRKEKRGPKHLSFGSGAIRSGVLPPHRRSQRLKEKRENSHKRILDRHERRVARAREGLTKLRREAEALMKPEHMDTEDKIFFEQLGKLELDQGLEHDLEQCRQRMVRAAAEAPQRRREHAERDAEASKLWGERQDEEARDEQQRHVTEFVRASEEQDAARFRRMEEAAMRVDEQRQRAHQALERQIVEEQERRFRQGLARKAKEEEQERRLREERQRQLREEAERRVRQEMARKAREEEERRRREERERQLREERQRKLREEIECKQREEQEHRARQFEELREHMRRLQAEKERQLREEAERRRRAEQEYNSREERARRCREAHERFMREERERQARTHAEQARRTAAQQEGQVQQHLALYEAKWNELRTNTSLPPIDVREMPWPVFGVVSSEEQITYQDVRKFLFHPQRPGVEGKTARDKVKAEVLRFHPDKFNARILPKIQPSQRAAAQAISGAVARILTRIMTEEGQ